MTVRIVGMEPRHWETMKPGLEYTDKTQGIIAEDDKGILAAAILQHWTHSMVEMHAYTPRPVALRHGFLEEVFNHVFNTCGMQVALATTAADNLAARRIAKHLGFRKVFSIPDGYKPGVAFDYWQMRREDCRWIGDSHEFRRRYA